MTRSDVAVLVLALACGAPAERPADTIAATTPTPVVVSIVAKDFSFEAPDTITSGFTTIRLSNQGPEPHHVQLVRLLEGKTYADFASTIASMKPGAAPPAWMRLVAGPNVPDGASESNLTLSLEPGQYALVCFVESADHAPHFAKGMMQPLTVVPATGPTAPAPVADITVSLSDYTWSFSSPLTVGPHTLKLENVAQQPHEFVLLKLAEGKAAADAMKWLETISGPPPFAFFGGSSNFGPGDAVYTSMDFTAGSYLLVCFYPDAKDGKPHFMHGMVLPFSIS